MNIFKRMEQINELTFNQMTPIKTQYHDVSKYKYLRINTHSINTCELLVIFSDDGERQCNVSRFQIFQSTWITNKIECIMKFIKFVTLTNREYHLGENTIEIDTKGVLFKKSNNNDEELKKEDNKKSLMSRLKASYSPQNNNKKDERFPELLFRNQLLAGGYGNKVVCLPKGVYGEVLTYDVCGNLLWMPIEDLIANSK